MKKIFLLAALVGASSSVMAEGITTKLDGIFLFETAFRNQSKVPTASQNLSADKKNVAMSSEGHVALTASGETDEMKYGARIDVQTTTQSNGWTSFGGSHIFTESDYGKWQFGSAYDAGSQMRVSGLDLASGTGDNWTSYAWFDNQTMTWVNTPGASVLTSNYKTSPETSRKITYFTPKFADKVQFGVSYIPDARNLGTSAFSVGKDSIRSVENVGGITYTENPGVKDAFSLGATFEQDLSDCMSLKVALTGEVGKSSRKGTAVNAAQATREYKIDGMKTYNIGAILNCGVMSFAGSYADLGKSLTSRELDGASKRKTRFYTAGTAYNQGPVGLSLTYVRGERVKNKVDAYTIGTDYKLAAGFTPYVEVTYFKGKGRKLAVYNDPTQITTKGTVALIGATLKF